MKTCSEPREISIACRFLLHQLAEHEGDQHRRRLEADLQQEVAEEAEGAVIKHVEGWLC